MPELPEVEVVRRGLEPVVTRRRITGVQVLHPRSVRRHPAGPDDFEVALVGRTISGTRRRGKYLWFPMADGDAILGHLGMSGQFRVDIPSAPLQRHARVLVDLDDGQQVRFVDQRLFGGLALSPSGASLPAEIAHIARDLMDPALDMDALCARAARSRSGIKRVLLDQSVVSGIGNIYADEALWAARVHHATPASDLGAEGVRDVLAHARLVMERALAEGGTSFDALYVHVNGESGFFDRSLEAYGRTDLHCRRCGTPIVREPFANRSSFRCPTCQPSRDKIGQL